ncbi:MAG TPA: sulfatase-like hydrolase/transferase [Verrucomicrobiae bacterium]|nr:sulfatase-like hydrolase/transferase [Verrucomicrobiae bacterium]
MKTAILWLLALVLLPISTPAAERPNIVLALADDLGYGDLACFGAKDLHTPNLDRLATEGLRLTSCYAGHANCSPARTALMTGRTPTRVGVRNWIPQDSPVHVRSTEITVATLLRQAGYATCHSGKWHLNGGLTLPGQPQPGDHGFEYWFSTQNIALPSHRDPDNFVRNGTAVGKLQGYSADIVADEAIRWLREIRDKDKPFFLYLCFHEPHEPIATAPRHTALYPSDDPSYSAHHGNITQMDDAFGRLMAELHAQRLTNKTLVFFTSDNGPAITPQHPHGSAGPLRDKKGSLYEGGIRVPGILRWPGHIKPGSVSDEPACGVDFLPTACDLAGIAPPSDRAMDGTSLLPIFEGRPLKRTVPLYWHFNRATSAPKVAMRVGDWKILATLDKPPQGRPTNDITDADERDFKTAELSTFELYNLRNDIGESKDLATANPDKFRELRGLLERKYAEVRSEGPTWPAWKFTGAEGKRIERPDYTKRPRRTQPSAPRAP